MTKTLQLALLTGLLGLPVPVMGAGAPGADPAINRPYADPDFAHWEKIFERQGREVYDQRNAIAAAAGVRPGMAVADIGAGTGLFTRLFARAVGPEGRVYAVDISRVFIDNIAQSARQQGIGNISGIVNTQRSAMLPAGSVDLAFLCDTYHHFEFPVPMLQSIHAALRPGGRLVIVDFKRVSGVSSAWVMEHVRAGKEEVIREVENGGFRFREEKDFLRDNFYIVFDRIDER